MPRAQARLRHRKLLEKICPSLIYTGTKKAHTTTHLYTYTLAPIFLRTHTLAHSGRHVKLFPKTRLEQSTKESLIFNGSEGNLSRPNMTPELWVSAALELRDSLKLYHDNRPKTQGLCASGSVVVSYSLWREKKELRAEKSWTKNARGEGLKFLTAKSYIIIKS